MANTINAALGKITNTKISAANQFKEDFDKDKIIGIKQRVVEPNVGEPNGDQQEEKPAGTNDYSNIAGNKQAYTPNSEGYSNTGSGAESAVGTKYSWEKDASDKAQKTYSSDVLTQKQQALTNRQTIENNAVNYQTQGDMMKYQENQNAEKVGWTGGYVLDQNRQMDYLKASIQAQMYGAMELQKYGLDSSLAAARLSYDLNQQEYARQYYEEAVSSALSEAQLTGVYFSAETKDMMSQLAVANQKVNDQSLPQEERDAAQRLIDTIEGWFTENKISKEGVKTLAAWEADQSNELQWSNELWTRYNAAMEAAKDDISTNADAFIMLDENGKELWDGVNVSTGNWNTISGSDIVKYLENDNRGMKLQQFYGYIDTQLAGQSVTGFSKWLKDKEYVTKDENGNETKTTSDTYEDLYGEYLGESNVFADFLKEKFKGLTEEESEVLAEKLDGYDLTISLPDGTTKTYTLHVSDKEPSGGQDGSSDKPTDQEERDGDGVLYPKPLKDNISYSTLIDYLSTDYSTVDAKTLNAEQVACKKVMLALDELTTGDYAGEQGWLKTLENVTNSVSLTGGLLPVTGMASNAIESWATASTNLQKAETLEGYRDLISLYIGQTNLNKILQAAKEYQSMDERTQLGLNETKKKNYESSVSFMNKIDKLNALIDYYRRNDSVPFTWEYVADSWDKVGNKWSNMNNVGDFFGALGSSVTAVATTVVSGAIGFLKKFFTWNW